MLFHIFNRNYIASFYKPLLFVVKPIPCTIFWGPHELALIGLLPNLNLNGFRISTCALQPQSLKLDKSYLSLVKYSKCVNLLAVVFTLLRMWETVITACSQKLKVNLNKPSWTLPFRWVSYFFFRHSAFVVMYKDIYLNALTHYPYRNLWINIHDLYQCLNH